MREPLVALTRQQAQGTSPRGCQATCAVSTPRRWKSAAMKLWGTESGMKDGHRGTTATPSRRGSSRRQQHGGVNEGSGRVGPVLRRWGTPRTPTYSAAGPGASEPMKEQGAPSSDSTVQELEAFPPRCQRCDRHLRGTRGCGGRRAGLRDTAVVPPLAVPGVRILGWETLHDADDVQAHQPHAHDPPLPRGAARLCRHPGLCGAGPGPGPRAGQRPRTGRGQ